MAVPPHTNGQFDPRADAMSTREVTENTSEFGAMRQLELTLHPKIQASAEIVQFPSREDERSTEALTKLLRFAETLGARNTSL